MNRSLILVGLTLMAAGLVWTIARDKVPSHEPNKAPLFEENNFSNWYLYNAPNNKFRAFFPSKPHNASTKIVNGQTQEPAIFATYFAQDPKGLFYLISAIAYPQREISQNGNKSDDLQDLNDGIRDIVLSNPSNQLVETKEGQFRQLKTIDYKIANDKAITVGKAFKDNGYLYLMSVTNQDGDVNPENFAFFTNSFDSIKLNNEQK